MRPKCVCSCLAGNAGNAGESALIQQLPAPATGCGAKAFYRGGGVTVKPCVHCGKGAP